MEKGTEGKLDMRVGEKERRDEGRKGRMGNKTEEEVRKAGERTAP